MSGLGLGLGFRVRVRVRFRFRCPSGKCPSGMSPSGTCQSGTCPRSLSMTSAPGHGKLPGFWGSMVFRHAPLPRKGSGNNNNNILKTRFIALTRF